MAPGRSSTGRGGACLDLEQLLCFTLYSTGASAASQSACCFSTHAAGTTQLPPPDSPPLPLLGAAFTLLADSGIAVYSGDAVGHGKSGGDRIYVPSFATLVSACPHIATSIGLYLLVILELVGFPSMNQHWHYSVTY